MIAQILLPGCVAKHDPESAVGVDVSGFLQVQFIKCDHVLDGLGGIARDHGEVRLSIYEPVVGHGIHGAVFEIKPNEIVLFGAIPVDRDLVALWSEGILKAIGIEG